MAAGDIILSGGTTITAAEIQQIAAEVKKELAAESKELSQFEEVTSLANVSSLPGIQQSGATMKLVRVALEVLKGVDGKNIELTASQTAIQWRYVGESAWNTLVDLSLLKGPKGDTGGIGPQGETGATGATGPQGEPGKKVMLRKGTSGIEWKYEGDGSWQTLVPMTDLSFTFDELTDEQKQEISRKPILGTVEATKGDTPSGSFTSDGTDEHGNPKYKLNLVLPKGDKGDKGEPPVIEQGTVTTGNPGTEASVEVVPNGETDEGNPKYILNFTIPKGDPGKDGEGAGNVYVLETGLVSGKQYLFQPGANGSANGTFVEYTPPEIPEQVQPDWNATEGKGAILNKPTILSEAPKDGKQYARKDGAWAEVEAGDELSKEAIEKALTGNITTHRHDTTYQETTFETDVWDGTSISDSLQGSGTKEDPYLIQSCADWLHLYVNGPAGRNIMKDMGFENFDGFKPVVKVMKNLDFGNKTIPYPTFISSSDFFLGWEFDGNNSTISNFVANKEGGELQVGCIPAGYPLFIHNFNLDNVQIETSIEGEGIASFFSTLYDYIYNLVVNNVIDGKCTITGNASKEKKTGIIIVSTGVIAADEHVTAILEPFLKENGYYLGTNITIEDNTTKDEGVQLQVMYTSQVHTEQELNGYDSSFSNLTGIVNGSPVGEGNFVSYISIMGNSSNFYYNNTKSNGLLKQSINEHTPAFVSENGKTTEEMKSDAFVAELNSQLPKPTFKKDPEGGTPILAQYGEIEYDGYVKQSEFEAFKAKLSVETPAEGSPFVDIALTTSQFPTYGDVIELNTEQYNTIKSGLLNGKILRVKAVCGIFFGSTTTLIPTYYGSREVNPENSIPAVLIWATNPSEEIGGGAPISAVQFTVYFSKDTNESGNYEATFYGMKGNFVLSEEIDTIKKLTQSEYDGLSSKDSETLYVIVG